MQKTALIIIDMQKGLVKDNPYKQQKVIANIKKLRKGAREQKLEVLYVCHDGGKGDELEKGTKGFEIVEDLKPDALETVIVKEKNSAFYETNLDEYLKEKEITDLIICGMQTEFCIDATVKSAFERKYKVHIPKKATTTFSNKYMKAKKIQSYYEVFMWQDRFAKLESVGTILDHMRRKEKEQFNIIVEN